MAEVVVTFSIYGKLERVFDFVDIILSNKRARHWNWWWIRMVYSAWIFEDFELGDKASASS